MNNTFAAYTDGTSALAYQEDQPIRRFDYDFDAFDEELDAYRHPIRTVRSEFRQAAHGTCAGLSARHHSLKDKVIIGAAFAVFFLFMAAEAVLLAM